MHNSILPTLTTLWWACYAAANLQSTFQGPHTFDELHVSLKDLGFEVVEASPALPFSSLAFNTTASSRGCAATVSSLPGTEFVRLVEVPNIADLAVTVVLLPRRPYSRPCESSRQPDIHTGAVQLLVQSTSRDCTTLSRNASQCRGSCCDSPGHILLPMSLCCEEWRSCCLCRGFQHPRWYYDRSTQPQPGASISGQDFDESRSR